MFKVWILETQQRTEYVLMKVSHSGAGYSYSQGAEMSTFVYGIQNFKEDSQACLLGNLDCPSSVHLERGPL